MTTFVHTRLLFFASGLTVCPGLVLIHPDKDSTPLRAHELIHVGQMKKHGTLTFWFKYLTNKQFRQDMEVEAYKTSIIYGDRIGSCAFYLSAMYKLGITEEQAVKLLSD